MCLNNEQSKQIIIWIHSYMMTFLLVRSECVQQSIDFTGQEISTSVKFVDNEVFLNRVCLDFEINKTSFIRKLSFVDIFYNFGPKLRWQTHKMHESHHEI